ncbi:MAG: hypothetical protein PGN16_15395 [Sphingomonas phyllosphaerae]|uniref:hypothetical protein n=1 Tax=Sphingomonas phyllosphaerae TaxID=257003 RepID=UPI002FF88BB9
MAAIYRLKGLGWLTGCAIVAIGFYLVSSQVAAERKRLEQVDRRILSAERDIRALETEFDVRANLAQLERWNGNTLALTVPTAQQFVRDERALAALSPVQGLPAPGRDVQIQTAQLIVPRRARRHRHPRGRHRQRHDHARRREGRRGAGRRRDAGHRHQGRCPRGRRAGQGRQGRDARSRAAQRQHDR